VGGEGRAVDVELAQLDVGDGQQLVVVPASGGADVEGFGGGALVDDGEGLVDGDALGFVHGGGVREVHVPGIQICGREGGGGAGVFTDPLNGEAAVGGVVLNLPAVTVADRGTVRSNELAVVSEGRCRGCVGRVWRCRWRGV